MSNVVVLSGGQWQKPIISFLKTKHRVIVVHPFSTETTLLADECIYEDVRNVQKIRHRLYEYDPIFVTTDQSDIAVLPTAILSSMLETPGNTPAAAELFSSKLAMARFCTKHNLSTPEYQYVKDSNDISLDLPFVIKPVDANASKGFVKISDKKDINFSSCLGFSYVGGVLAQKYIRGKVYVLDGFCSGHKHKTLTHAVKTHFRDGVASSISYPSDLAKEILEKMISANNEYVEKSGLSFGITHAEYIVDSSGFYLLEIAARGGGFLIGSEIIPWVSGFNVYDALYDNLVGKTTNLEFQPLSRPARLQFFEYQTGYVDVYETSDIMNIPFVRYFRTVNGYVSPAVDGTTRHVSVLILAENDYQVEETLNKIRKIIDERSNIKINR